MANKKEKPNNPLAKMIYQNGCDFYYGKNGVEKDMARAIECWQSAAEEDNADAQAILAVCYYKGEGIEQNTKKALELARKSAKQGNVAAQTLINLVERPEVLKEVSNELNNRK
jgi:TPR repeat protein